MKKEIFNLLHSSQIENDISFIYWVYKIESIIILNRRFLKIYLFNREFNNKKLETIKIQYNNKKNIITSFDMVSQYSDNNIIGCSFETAIDEVGKEIKIIEEVVEDELYKSKKNKIKYVLNSSSDDNYIQSKNNNYKNMHIVFPQINDVFWQCSCGRIHSVNDVDCLCGLKINDNKEIINFNIEEEKTNDYIKKITYDYKKTFEQNINEIKDQFEKSTKISSEKLFDKINVEEERAKYYENKEKKDKEDRIKKKRKKTLIISTIAVMAICMLAYYSITFFIPEYKYKKAQEMLEANRFEDAILSLEKLNYKDSEVIAKQAKYDYGCYCLDNGDIEKAYEIIENLESNNYKGYKDILKKVRLLKAESLFKEKKYKEATDIMDVIQMTFNEDKKLRNNIYYEYAKLLYEKNNLADAYKYIRKISDSTIHEDYDKIKNNICYDYGNECFNKNEYEQAIIVFNQLEKKDNSVNQLINDSKYKYVVTHKDNKNMKTYNYLEDLKAIGNKKAETIYKELYAWKATVIINNSETDRTTDKQSVARYSTWYCHIKTEGGTPGETINLNYTTSWPNSSPLNGKLEGFKDGSTGWCSFWYTDYGTYGGTGTFKINIYTENGTYLCSDSVMITK